MSRIRIAQLVIAGALTVTTLVLASVGVAVFRAPSPPATKASLWHLVLADPLALGSVRLAIVAAGLFVLISVPALVLEGRWLRAFGPSGVTTAESDEERRLSLIEQNQEQLMRRAALMEALYERGRSGSIG